MKLKYLTMSMIVSFLFAGIGTIQSQGVYSISDKKTLKETPTTTSTTTSQADTNSGGLFRGIGGGGTPGSGSDPAPGPDVGSDPIGEGILILTLLSGGYSLVRRKTENKK